MAFAGGASSSSSAVWHSDDLSAAGSIVASCIDAGMASVRHSTATTCQDSTCGNGQLYFRIQLVVTGNCISQGEGVPSAASSSFCGDFTLKSCQSCRGPHHNSPDDAGLRDGCGYSSLLCTIGCSHHRAFEPKSQRSNTGCSTKQLGLTHSLSFVPSVWLLGCVQEPWGCPPTSRWQC